MYISTVSAVIPCFAALWFIRDVYAKNRPFVILLIVTFVVEVIAVYLSLHRANNMWLYSSFTVVEFALLTASLQRMQYQKAPVAVTGAFVLLMLAITLADVLYISRMQQYNSFPRILECLLLIALSLFAFYDLIKNHIKQSVHLTISPLFWLALATLVYMAGNLFVFAVTNILSANNDPAYRKAWVIHSILNFVFNIMLLNVVLCLKKAPSYTT